MAHTKKQIMEWLQKIREHISQECGVDIAQVYIRVGTFESSPTMEELRDWQRKIGLEQAIIADDPATEKPQ